MQTFWLHNKSLYTSINRTAKIEKAKRKEKKSQKHWAAVCNKQKRTNENHILFQIAMKRTIEFLMHSAILCLIRFAFVCVARSHIIPRVWDDGQTVKCRNYLCFRRSVSWNMYLLGIKLGLSSISNWLNFNYNWQCKQININPNLFVFFFHRLNEFHNERTYFSFSVRLKQCF